MDTDFICEDRCPEMGFTFKKEDRLLKRWEFLAVTEHGRKLHTKSFIVFTRSNDLGRSRIGVTVSRKVGNAVKRNRIKRVVREFFRLNRYRIMTGTDIVVIAKREAAGKGFSEVVSELLRALAPTSVKEVR